MGKYVCTECGSDKIQVRKWVDPNTDSVIDWADDGDCQCWCGNCEEITPYEYKEDKPSISTIDTKIVKEKFEAIAASHNCKVELSFETDDSKGYFFFDKCNVPLLADVRIACDELGIPRKCIEFADSWGYIGIDLDEIDEEKQ